MIDIYGILIGLAGFFLGVFSRIGVIYYRERLKISYSDKKYIQTLILTCIKVKEKNISEQREFINNLESKQWEISGKKMRLKFLCAIGSRSKESISDLQKKLQNII